MSDTHKDLFPATMRIEIPPDLDLQNVLDQKAEGARQPKRVVRIARAAPPPDTFGGADFQALLQNIYDACVITDLHGRIVNANVRAMHFFGYDLQEFAKLGLPQVVSGANDELLRTIWRSLQGNRFVLMQAICTRKDASVFPAEISANRLRLADTDYLSFFIRDVTLRKEAEERLKTTDTAMRNAGSGIAIVSDAGRLQYCNPAILRLWGIEDADGADIRDFLADPGLADEMDRAVKGGEFWSREVVMKRRDGGIVYTQLSAAPNVKPDGKPAGMVLSLLDISSLKHAQAQLEAYAQELRRRNEDMEQDLEMAREVQLAFLPRESPAFPPGAKPGEAALAFSHLYHPSGVVGGDFFDIIPLTDLRAGILIADVVGHGARAALVVATLRGLIEQLTPVAQDPAVLLTGLNRAYRKIFERTSETMFATMLYMVIDAASGTALCSSAGHPPPFLLQPATGTAALLAVPKEAQGPGLGLYESPVFRNLEFDVQAGDVLLLYTDGLSDVWNDRKQYYDVTRMPACLAENLGRPPAELLAALTADAKRFAGREDFEDDLCMLAAEVRRVGVSGPAAGS